MLNYKSLLSRAICRTPFQYWPVYVRTGLARGARWTLFPHSANWRLGGERDVETAVRLHGDLTGETCWDLGAHFGIHTVGLAKCVGPLGQVCAFEPDPVAYHRLERHVNMNSLQRVKCFNRAVSDQDGQSDMIISGELGSTFTHLQYSDEPVNADTPVINIVTQKLDTLVASGEIRAPDFIKVDVQGHGANALRGAIVSLTAKRPTIVFSSHSPDELRGVKALVSKLGYWCYDCDGNRCEWPTDCSANLILIARSSPDQIQPL